MSNLRSLTLALGAIALVTAGMTATAGSWPNLPARKTAQASNEKPVITRNAKQETSVGRDSPSTSDFEYVGGDSGWQLRQHQYSLRGGSVVHAPECTLVASATAVAAPATAPRKSF